MKDLEKAQSVLEEENCTCVLCRQEVIYTSQRRGVAPLLQLLDDGADVAGAAAADRVVGKATAFLYSLLGVQAVYARVMSVPASQVLERFGIRASWGTLVDGIQNRQKNGPCPMEYATRNCTTPEEALQAVRKTLETLRQKENS